MTHAIKKHLGDFAAILALVAVAVGTTGYILVNQDARPAFPLIEEKPFTVEAEFTSAQAVVPGQGQSVRVAGVQVGKIRGVEVENGLAVVQMDIERRFEDLVRQDASALLRPRTGLKDMFVELDPGTRSAPPMEDGGRISVENTAPDIDPDEILSALDTDTRAYLKLLVNGAGKGLDNRGDDLREVFQRFLPLHRDLAKVQGAFADRRKALANLVHNYGLLTEELGKNDESLTRLVSASEDVFTALASEDDDISRAVALLPGTLRQTEATLRKVQDLGTVLGPTLDDLRPAFRQLDETNREVLPLVRQGTPILRDEIRPFTRRAQPYIETLIPTSRELSASFPDTTTAFGELNRFFNMFAFNPKGPEEAGKPNPEIGVDPFPGDVVGSGQGQGDPRDEGYLYWLAWVVTTGSSTHSASDAEGTVRRGAFSLNCQTLQSLIVPQLPEQLRAGLEQGQQVLGNKTLGQLLGAGALGPLSAGFNQFVDAFNDRVLGGAVPAPGPFIDALLQCIGLGEIDFSSEESGSTAAQSSARASRSNDPQAPIPLEGDVARQLENLDPKDLEDLNIPQQGGGN
ncbi:MAG TPA: MlaD family protein [Thermoleophilaceae bacterium]|nr:MlaD family protein [Thermoleophilaceae bacterium]